MPREMTAPANGSKRSRRGASGIPVFTTAGELVGVHTEIESGVEESSAGFFFGGGMGLGGGHTFVLPAKVTAAKIRLAQKQAAEMAEEHAADAAKKAAADQEEEKKKKEGDDGR